ncbi:MAG: iron-sulfur cluster assembly scaffold protein [Myxococcota bacterium]
MADLKPALLDRARDLSFAGRLDPARDDVGTGVAEDGAHAASVRLQLVAAGGFIDSACFFAYGCPATLASASWVAEWAHGKGLNPGPDASELAAQAVLALELPPSRAYAATLAALALCRAIGDRLSKR